MGWWDRFVTFWETDHIGHLGARTAVFLRPGCGPTSNEPDEGPCDHRELREYARLVGLDLDQNMLVAVDNWLVVTSKKIKVTRPGPFRGRPAEFHWEESLAGASLVWWEYDGGSLVDPVVMFHITFASGRFTLASIHLDDDGDAQGFIDAFGASGAPIYEGLAEQILQALR